MMPERRCFGGAEGGSPYPSGRGAPLARVGKGSGWEAGVTASGDRSGPIGLATRVLIRRWETNAREGLDLGDHIRRNGAGVLAMVVGMARIGSGALAEGKRQSLNGLDFLLAWFTIGNDELDRMGLLAGVGCGHGVVGRSHLGSTGWSGKGRNLHFLPQAVRTRWVYPAINRIGQYVSAVMDLRLARRDWR